jgi:glycosyltransferase involved in cell wall biosynthesis
MTEPVATAAASESSVPLCNKLLLVVTEDWFALSHFKPLLRELVTLAREVVVVANSSGRLQELEALGVRTRHLDMRRGGRNPFGLLDVRRALSATIDAERPDIVHAISMQCMVLVGMALARSAHRPAAVVYHLTGTGYLSLSQAPKAVVVRQVAMMALRRARKSFAAWLLAENPDDVALMVRQAIVRPERTFVVPGAGIDASQFPAFPHRDQGVARVGFVGRMLRSKGVDVLVAAQQQLWAEGFKTELALYGSSDAGAHQAIPEQTLREWNTQPGIAWHGHTSNVVSCWQDADIAVVPSLGGEGMPRAMLEAAACARPLIVSDVPGCRHFVRNGVEGLVVPPGDVQALAAALRTLALDAPARKRLGLAARDRVASHYAEHNVRQKVREAYKAMCAKAAN